MDFLATMKHIRPNVTNDSYIAEYDGKDFIFHKWTDALTEKPTTQEIQDGWKSISETYTPVEEINLYARINDLEDAVETLILSALQP